MQIKRLLVFCFAIAGCDPLYIAPEPDLAMSIVTPELAMMTNQGGPVLAGPVLAAPEPVVVAWAGDDGVSRGSAAGEVILTSKRPSIIADSDIAAIVSAQAAAGSRNANTVYVVLVPKLTTVSNLGHVIAGYHSETLDGVPYIVLPQVNSGGSTPFENLTYVASHELAEAATDPYPFTNPAWYDPTLKGLGEIGDLCNPLGQYITAAVDGGMPTNGNEYLVTRVYDNSAAMRGHDPCYYSTDAPYFYVGATPRLAVSGGTTSLSFIGPADTAPIKWQVLVFGVGTVTPSGGTNSIGDRVALQLPRVGGPVLVGVVAQVGTESTVYDFLVSP